ncbi:hypothetical protein BC831DRAFT_189983 [Entophlyctis helioformis]|nr:hypothetical protein BC831DRAFT_189983 [Entophlyctis helioformis]
MPAANLQSAVWGGIAKAGDNVSDSIPGTPPSESAGVHDADAFTDSGPSSPVPEPAGQALALDETAADEEQQLMLNHLTLTLLEHAVATYTSTFPDNGPASPTSPSSSSGSNASATGDATFLVNTLRNVFSSVSSLSRSFLAEGSVVTNSSKLDIPSLRKSYHIILQLSPSSMFQTVLANALELLLAKLLLDTSKLHHAGPDLLRVVLILMENPLLLDPAYHESLLRKLSLVLGSIRTKSRTVLIRWLSQYDTAGFEKIIRVFQQYVVDHVYSGSSKLDESLIGAVKALSMLSHANESTSRKPITPHTTFQMPNLAQKLNFKEEYRTWRRSMQGSTSNGSGTGTVTEFSFFNFPFLLDPIAKTRILHIDARVQMSLVYEDAYVNQALMQHAQRFLVDSPRASNLEQEMKQKTNPFLVLEIRRERLVDDVLDQITKRRWTSRNHSRSGSSVAVKRAKTKAVYKRSFSRCSSAGYWIRRTACLYMTRRRGRRGSMARRWSRSDSLSLSASSSALRCTTASCWESISLSAPGLDRRRRLRRLYALL